MSCVIAKCDCEHAFQDKRYGKGMRVHNRCFKKGDNKRIRCTVCGKEKDI